MPHIISRRKSRQELCVSSAHHVDQRALPISQVSWLARQAATLKDRMKQPAAMAARMPCWLNSRVTEAGRSSFLFRAVAVGMRPGRGHDLYRLLDSMGWRARWWRSVTDPKGGSDKVMTDKRDARRLAPLGRARELTVQVPSERRRRRRRGGTWRGPGMRCRPQAGAAAADRGADAAWADLAGGRAGRRQRRHGQLLSKRCHGEHAGWQGRRRSPIASSAAAAAESNGDSNAQQPTPSSKVAPFRTAASSAGSAA